MPHVATCLVLHEGKLLLLKRSEKVRTYKGQWGAVAGYIEHNETPLETAYKELKEEANIDKEDATLLQEGDLVKYSDEYEGQRYDWIIHPFLFKIEKKGKVQIDWEHSEYTWVMPRDLSNYETVPRLKEIVYKMCL